MRIVLAFDEDEDSVPCVCKIRPIITAFPSAKIAVVSGVVGDRFAAALARARIPVELVKTSPELPG